MKTKSNKLLSLLLSLALLFSAVTVFSFSASAAEEERPNLLVNPSFEEMDEAGLPLGLTPQGNTWEAACSVTEEVAHSGAKSLKIENGGQYSQPWTFFTVSDLSEGTTYEISAFVRTDKLNAGGSVGFKVEAYDKFGANFYGKDGTVNFAENTNNMWAPISGTFVCPVGTEYIKLYARLYATTGVVYFDDVAFRIGEAPNPYLFDVNTKAHYADVEFGTATVSIHNYYNGQNVGDSSKVAFSLVDPETGNVVDSFNADSMPGDSVTYQYPTAKMEPMQKEFDVRAVVTDKDGNEAAVFSERVAKFNRPSRLTKDGKYMFEDGVVFHPNIAYHHYVGDYVRAEELGINVVQVMITEPSTAEQALADAEKHNLKILACLYGNGRAGSHPDNMDNLRTIIEMLKGNETVFAYALMDEPFVASYNQEMKDMLWEGYKAIKKIDEEVPVFLVDAYSMYFYEDVKYCDIFYSENYAAGTKASQMALEQARVCEAAGRYWGVLGGTYRSSASFQIQNSEKLRDTFYRSFAAGAKGIGYYAISDADGVTGQALYRSNPEIWEGLSKYAHEELPELFEYYSEQKYATFGRFFTTDPGTGQGEYYEAWVKDNALSMVVHNQSSEEKTLDIPMVSSNGRVKIGAFQATPLAGSTEAISGNGTLSVTLAPNQAIFYRITPDANVDFSAVGEETGSKNHFVPVGYVDENAVADENKPTGTFGDLVGYEWASEQIQALYDEGIVNDKNIYAFAPGDNITREDFVVFLVRALGLSGEGEAFPDCDTAEVKTARGLGIVTGDTNGNFNPKSPITRQDLFTVAGRARGVSDYAGEVPAFSDWEQVADYARGSIAAMTAAGVILGNGDGTLRPLDFTTRAQAAVLLFRLRDAEFPEVKPEEAPGETTTEKEEITFTGTPSELTLQKWSDAADLLKALEIGEISVETSITKGEFEVLVSGITGAAYNYFEDDLKALRYEEAVEALVELLGYGVYTARDGGYIAVASRMDLTKGITPSGEYIRGGELALLIANAIDIFVTTPASYGTGADGRYATTDETLLSMYKNTYKFDGVVEQNWYTSGALKKEQTIIDGLLFEGGSDFLGQRVTVYASVSDDVRTIMYIAPKNAVKVLELDAESISVSKSNTSRICYDTGKDEVYEEIAGAKLIKNGRYKENWTVSDIMPDEGTVTLIANSGNAVDYIIVWSYVNRVVDKVFKMENLITFKEGASITFDKSDTSVRALLLRTNGAEADITVLGEYNVLSVAESEDGAVRLMRYSSKNVSGTVEEVSDKTVTIEGKEYKIAASLRNSTILKMPTLGQSAKFYLDYADKIAVVDGNSAYRNYGYFTTAQLGKGIDKKLTFRIFTTDDEMKIMEAAESFRLNQKQVSAEEVMASTVLFNGEKPIGQLVVYETNEEGKITEMTTAADLREYPFLFQADVNVFGLLKETNSLNSGFYKYGGQYRHNTSTVWFSVPEFYSADEKNYRIIPNSEVTHEGMPTTGKAYFYDLSPDYYVGAIVKVGTSASEVAINAPAGVITDITTRLDADGMPVRSITVLDKLNNVTKLDLPSDDFRVMFGQWCLTDVQTDAASIVSPLGLKSKPEYILADQLDKGDVISWQLNSITGLVDVMQVYFRANSMPNPGTTNPGLGGPDGTYDQKFVGYLHAAKVVDLGFIIAQPHERIFNFWSYSTRYNVLCYEKETGKCYKLDYTDVRDGENIVYISWAYMMQLGVVYR